MSPFFKLYAENLPIYCGGGKIGCQKRQLKACLVATFTERWY